MNTTTNYFFANLFQLNLAILFISTSGVLGRYIDLPIPITIGLRALLAGIILLIFCKWKSFHFKIASKDKTIVLIGGILLGVHWITYFYALKLSNVAIGMLSLFTFPAITAILEPLFLKTKILPFHLFLGGIILLGIYLLVPNFSFENSYFKAVCFGTLSAFSFAIRNIIMKPQVEQYNGSVLMVYQLLVVGFFLSPFFFFLDCSNITKYLPATLLLAILTTSIGHTLFLYSFRHFSAISASIISCLQPVYGIILGIFFLHEYPSLTTLLGGGIIISSVFVESFRVYQLSRKK